MRRVVFAILSTIAGLVLLLTFKTQTGTASAIATPPAAIATPSTSSSSSSSSSKSSAGSASPSAGATPSTSSGSTGTKTYTGTATETRYGPVQVQVTVTNGTITKVAATVYPTDNPRDQEINSYAVPQLDQEATAAKSAQIDTVSGATYTSEGYLSSLQSALDQVKQA